MVKWNHKKQLQKGQSTIEYVLLVTAVITVILLFVMGNNSPFRRHLVNETLNVATDTMNDVAGRFATSHN